MADEFIPSTTPASPTPEVPTEAAETPYTIENKPLSPEVAQTRATQAQYGFEGKLNVNYPAVYQALSEGQEQSIRSMAVMQLQAKGYAQRNALVDEMTRRKGGPLSGDEYDEITQAVNDPRSVIEDHYSNRYMNELKWPKQFPDATSWMNTLYPKVDDTINGEINLGTQYKAASEFWKSVAQDSDDAVSRQSWLGYGWDQIKNLTTAYPWYQMHYPGTSWFQLPGSAQEEAMMHLLSLPYDEMKNQGMAFYNELKDKSPTLAREFANNMVGMSMSSKFLQNVLPIAVPGVEVSAAANVAKSLGRGFATRSAIRTAVRQAIETELPSTLSPEATSALVSGNLGRGIISRATDVLISRTRGSDPVADAIFSLPAVFRVAKERLIRNTGTGDRAIAGTNALLDEYDNLIQRYPELIAGLTRAEAIPTMAQPNQEILAAAQQIVRSQYRHLNNRILSPSEPFKDPVTGHWYMHLDIGETPTDYFGTAERADRVAKENSMDGFAIYKADRVWTPGEKIGLETEGPILQRTPPVNEGYSRFYTWQTIKDNVPYVGPYGHNFTTDIDRALATGERVYYYDIKNTDTQLLPQMIRRGMNPTDYFTTNDVFVNHAKEVLSDIGPKPIDVQIRQQGTGYYIRKTVPLPADAPGMRNYYAMLGTDSTPNPGGVLSSFLARFRTPNETLSQWQTRNRELATFASSALEKYAFEQAEAIRKLTPFLPYVHKKWDEFERVLNNARFIRNPDTGKMGYTYQNVGELQYGYMRELGRLPDDQETAAYFAFKRVNEMDHVLRTISIVRNKARFGTMEHRFYTVGKDGKVFSKWFDAIPMSEYPEGTHTKVIIGNQRGQEMLFHDLGQVAKEYWTQKIKSGEYQIAKLYAPSGSPLAGWGKITADHQVVYVISKNFETRNISWDNQLPFQGGGHFVPEYDHYLKQIAMKAESIGGKTHYYSTGVKTLMPVINEAEGRAIMGHFNNIANLLKRMTPANVAAARNIVENTLHMDWQEVKEWFRPSPIRRSDGSFGPAPPPVFNLTEPFQLVRSNQNLLHLTKREDIEARYKALGGIYHEAWKNGGDTSLAHSVEFSQERDWDTLMTLNNKGTLQNPAYAWEPAKLLDAIPTMNRAFNKISNSIFMDDYKFSAIESWLREAREYLNVNDKNLRSSPLYWFHHAEFNKAATADAQIAIAHLEVTRKQIQQFMGQVSPTDALIHAWTQKLSDKIYESAPRLAKWIDPAWTAHTLQDPTRFLRTVTFHMKMGLFSIPQILVQGQTYVNIMGIAGPSKAIQGTTAALMHWFSKINENPRILQALDRHAQKFGWKPGEFLEARDAMISTGFDNVGTEYALRDNPMSNRVVPTKWGQFLDLGATPFKWGEQNVRFGAWYTAYKEFRAARPTGALSNADKLEILNRASLLNGNMNRASNAIYQKGFAALPAQFLTYTIRQAELIWGRRLTNTEKFRLLATNAMAYGLPIGLGITGMPADFFRNNAIKNGYTPGEDYMNTLITEGIPSTILGLTTGRYYNIGERYGNQGLTDFFYGDKTLWDLATGASGSSVASILEAFDPFRQAIMSGIRQDGNSFTITPQHVAEQFKEISSINNTWRAIAAAKTGQWLTKNGQVLTNDITPWEALFMYGTGLQPQETSDVYHMTVTMNDEKEVTQWAEKRAIAEYHRALRAYDNNDPSNGEAFMTNFMSYLKVYIPEEEWGKVIGNASDGYQTMIERVRQQFGTKDVPPWLDFGGKGIFSNPGARYNQYTRGVK
jgi:hypothetical protein